VVDNSLANQHLTDSLPPAVFLMGPTASGKTALAEHLAQRWPFEVISVDSALVYRDMNIGTAKPDADFLQRLPHHLINIRNPDESYSAAEFRRDALPLMQAITERGRIPLLVGGTMLYYKILLEGIADLPPADESIRSQILADAETHGWQVMHERLEKIDPSAAAILHPNHSQRIQRALEVFYATGETLSSHQARQSADPFPYRVAQFALWTEDRAALHARILTRFELMLEEGLIEEVAQLRKQYVLDPDMPSMRAVGYRQVWDYLDNKIDRSQLLEQGTAATRQLAKRQLTWLRKWPDLHRLCPDYEREAGGSGLQTSTVNKISSVLQELSL
jgi:tRNA dimethylallyltransferase